MTGNYVFIYVIQSFFAYIYTANDPARTIDAGFTISFMTPVSTRPNEIMHVSHNTLSDSYHQCMET